MNLMRIEQLLKFLEEDPNDVFARYALALEYQKSDPEKAEEVFDHVFTLNPDYLPAYYMAAMLKVELGKPEEAFRLLTKGVELARQCNNHSTLRELQEALQLLEPE
ncbi:MAG: tetratricopeptide repeat protein [Cyclobacteriaceae bacterium]